MSNHWMRERGWFLHTIERTMEVQRNQGMDSVLSFLLHHSMALPHETTGNATQERRTHTANKWSNQQRLVQRKPSDRGMSLSTQVLQKSSDALFFTCWTMKGYIDEHRGGCSTWHAYAFLRRVQMCLSNSEFKLCHRLLSLVSFQTHEKSFKLISVPHWKSVHTNTFKRKTVIKKAPVV